MVTAMTRPWLASFPARWLGRFWAVGLKGCAGSRTSAARSGVLNLRHSRMSGPREYFEQSKVCGVHPFRYGMTHSTSVCAYSN